MTSQYPQSHSLMAFERKPRKTGSSVGLVLPMEVLTYLKVGEGDTITTP